MDYLEEINKKIQQKLNQNHKQIILSYYQYLINNHNSFCYCNYCNILKQYVNLKILKVKYSRTIANCEIYNYNREVELKKEYIDIDNKIKELKQQKDKLKQL